MKSLVIEWRHYDKAGDTCDRCSSTGTTLSGVISELSREMEADGITLTFTETLLPEEEMAQSNLILINGIPLESLLDDATSSENSCQSCSCLTGKETSCRTVEHHGDVYEEIPAELIRQAVYRSLQRP